MTGAGRCRRRRKAMAGGRGTAVKEKIDGNRDSPNLDGEITIEPSIFEEITKLPPFSTFEFDLYTQARKALSFRSPFDSEDSQTPPAFVSGANTLPSGVSHLLSRGSDSRKRHKKLHSGSESKSSTPGKKQGRNVWVETEEYFRELTVVDVERLDRFSSVSFSSNDKCLLIPSLSSDDNLCIRYHAFNSMLAGVCEKDGLNLETGVKLSGNGKLEFNETMVQEDNGPHSMDADEVQTEELHNEDNNGEKRLNSGKGSASFSGVEWLLGSRSKIYLTTQRPSKKRKLFGRDAGLEKLLVARPVEGLESVCHYCSHGCMNDPLNCLIKCGSCGVVVHQRCYGVQEDADSTWVCSWCKWKSDGGLSMETPCLLCSQQGGALKPVQKRRFEREDERSKMEFAHLFCCQWMPEVYLENTRTMEPIMNVDEVKDTRRKMICYLCKVKYGACVQCSNGSCRTSFHPICAREARHRMEIWGKLGCDEVELRAFCSKHSKVQYDSGRQDAGNISLTAHMDLSELNDGLDGEDLLDRSRKSESQTENGDGLHPADKHLAGTNHNADVNTCSDVNFTMILNKLIDLGKVNAKDVDPEIGVSPDSYQDNIANDSIITEDELRALAQCLSEDGEIKQYQLIPAPSLVLKNGNVESTSYIHPFVYSRLIQTKSNMFEQTASDQSAGLREGENSQLEASSSSGLCCNNQDRECNGVNLDQLVKAGNLGMLKLSPTDEVEGELVYYQQRLLQNAVTRKRISDDLISKVVRSLPQEIDTEGKRKWDAVLINQYNHELKEAKKQGRKERRHKEAQAVLAAATAAAAASSRISSNRKDTLEESANEDLLKMNASDARAGVYSHQNLRVRETISRSGARSSVDKNSDSTQLASDHPKICDICRRSDTLLNPVLVCLSCKVAVHLDCYRSVKSATGPWHCELCEELLSSRGSGALVSNSWEKPCLVAECVLCSGTAGAFRKSVDGQWIHALCAEWVLESTYRRGQVGPIEGMDTVSKGIDTCTVCRLKQGVCLKCSYGHCHSMFHPTCARSAGFFMMVRTNVGKLQHKAYCEKHSAEQRAKADTQKHGVEEFKSLKQVRVELERLRLLCERIIKREKLKRELVVCSHDILARNRDSVLSTLARHPFYQPEVSSESATTSIRGYTDVNKSGSEMLKRSDDTTVDSTVTGKRRVKIPVSIDNDQKTDDSSTSQNLYTLKPPERASLSGKQIPQRLSITSRNLSDDAEKLSKYRRRS